MSMLLVPAVIAVWVYLDARARRQSDALLWAFGALLLAIVVVPAWIVKRPLREGETREGGTAWNVLKIFALMWTAFMAVMGFAAFVNMMGTMTQLQSAGTAAVAGGAIGTVLGIGLLGGIWFFPTVGAVALGFFLKKSDVERGPTGPLANPDMPPPPSAPSSLLFGGAAAAIVIVAAVVGSPTSATRDTGAASTFGTGESSPPSRVTMANFQRLEDGMSYEQVVEILGPGEDSPPSRVTMANFQRLEDGMSYEQVVEILGPGEELSRSDIAGTTTVVYQWPGAGFGNMNAMFQNGRLVQKAQFGLK